MHRNYDFLVSYYMAQQLISFLMFIPRLWNSIMAFLVIKFNMAIRQALAIYQMKILMMNQSSQLQ